jgi:endonuclease/exonuclease/phosphatase family metal-dependent hydrolase
MLTWNLMHGRAIPPAGQDLRREFADALAAWEWDVALLQEVPPWWPDAFVGLLGGGVQRRRVLTSRNAFLAVRKALAVRWPDFIKSNGGGANAILVKGSALGIAEHRTLLLRLWPERRRLQAVRLQAQGRDLWVGNLHATVHNDVAARQEAERARVTMVRWAGGSPLVLGGDFNVRKLSLAGLVRAAGHDVDHIFASGLEPVGEGQALDRGRLSDHAPVAVTLEMAQ